MDKTYQCNKCHANIVVGEYETVSHCFCGGDMVETDGCAILDYLKCVLGIDKRE